MPAAISRNESRECMKNTFKEASPEGRMDTLNELEVFQDLILREDQWSMPILGQYERIKDIDIYEVLAHRLFYQWCSEGAIYMASFPVDNWAFPDSEIEKNQANLVNENISSFFDIKVCNGRGQADDGICRIINPLTTLELPIDFDEERDLNRAVLSSSCFLEIGYNPASKTLCNLVSFGAIARMPYKNKWDTMRALTILYMPDHMKYKFGEDNLLTNNKIN